MSETVHVDQATFTAIRNLVLADPFEFAQIVCGHQDLSRDSHRPLLYLAVGCGDLLIDILDDDAEQSFVVRHLRKRFLAANADWRTASGRQRFFELLDFVNVRVFRGFGKSSALTHAGTTWLMTKYPDMSQVLFTNSEAKARDWCKQIRATVLGDTYKALFPERVPDDKNDMTESSIRLKGRTSPDKESTFMAFGFKASPTGYHWDRIILDDLVGKENRNGLELARALDFLNGIPFLMNPGRKFPKRRLHIGTRWDEEDDDFILRRIPHCLSVDVPIEYYPVRPDNIEAPGIPTCPEWANEGVVRAVKAECLADPTRGALEYRANYLLDPTIAGGRLFSTELIEASLWRPHEVAEGSFKRKGLIRPKYDPVTKEPVLKDDKPVYVSVRMNDLRVVLGADQSVSEEEGSDEWGVCAIGEDSEGVCYELETQFGHGIESMLGAIMEMSDTWNPRLIGLEKGGMQDTNHFWLKRDPAFARMRSRFVPISHNNNNKRWRFANGISEPMKTNRLYLNPASTPLHADMIAYRARDKDKDDKLDALAIAMATSKRPTNSSAVKKDVQTWMRKQHAGP